MGLPRAGCWRACLGRARGRAVFPTERFLNDLFDARISVLFRNWHGEFLYSVLNALRSIIGLRDAQSWRMPVNAITASLRRNTIALLEAIALGPKAKSHGSLACLH